MAGDSPKRTSPRELAVPPAAAAVARIGASCLDAFEVFRRRTRRREGREAQGFVVPPLALGRATGAGRGRSGSG